MSFTRKILFAGIPLAASLLGGCLPSSENAGAGLEGGLSYAASVSGSWTLIAGSANCIGVGAVDSAYMIQTSDNAVKYWANTMWNSTNGNAYGCDVGGNVGGSASSWVIGTNNRIYASYDHGQFWYSIGTRQFREIGASTGGAVYALGIANYPGTNDYPIFKWNTSTSAWDSLGGAGVRIEADPDGSSWIVNSSNEIYHCLSANYCEKFTSQSATDIGVGSNGKIWIISNTVHPNATNGDKKIYTWDGSSWQEANGGGRFITVDSNGDPWIVNNSGQIYRGDF